MIGWLILAVAALGTGVILWRIGFPLRLWTFAAAALMLAAAGYAWQGSPDLPGAPVAAEARRGTVDPVLVELRDQMFGRFDFSYGYFVAADAMTRTGRPDLAVKALLGGVHKAPEDGGLWTMLGLALSEHDGNVLSPPASYAFDRAAALAPRHPGPAFFRGLAHVRAGEFDAARRWWGRALALTPAEAPYRPAIAERLALLDRLLALRDAAPAAR